jgi:hypothetical protein
MTEVQRPKLYPRRMRLSTALTAFALPHAPRVIRAQRGRRSDHE